MTDDVQTLVSELERALDTDRVLGRVVDAAFDGSAVVALTETPFGTRAWRLRRDGIWDIEELPGVVYAATIYWSPSSEAFVVGGATSDHPAVWTSLDGPWQLHSLQGRPYDVRGITAMGRGVVAVGPQGVAGGSWREDGNGGPWRGGVNASFGSGAIVQDLTGFDGGALVAVGALDNRFTVWRSTDGDNWFRVEASGFPEELTEGGITAVEQTPFGLIALASFDRAFVSDDGQAWRVLFDTSALDWCCYHEITDGTSTVVVVGEHIEVLA